MKENQRNRIPQKMFCETATKTLLLSMICTWLEITTADLSRRPRDTETVVGLSTFLNCSTTINDIHWFHYPDGDDKQRHLVYGYNKIYAAYEGRFRVEKDAIEGVCNLIIISVELKDSGKYQCQDDFGKGMEHSAQLTVLESQPICESSMKPEGVIGPNRCGIPPEHLHLSCSVTFRGNRAPSIVWIKNGSETNLTEGATLSISANHVTRNLTLKPDSIADGDAFQCRTTASATDQYGCTPETVRVNGGSNDASFYVLSGLLAAAVVLWLLSFGFCLKLSMERRAWRAKNSKILSDAERFELDSLAKNNQLEDDVKQLKVMNERLTEKVAGLEERFYCRGKIDYLSVPNLVHTTETVKSKTIRGIAVLGGELFAVFEKSPDIEVFDSRTFVSKQPFKGVDSSSPDDLLWDPQDLTASEVNACLFVIHQTRRVDKRAEIWKVDPANRRKLLAWSLECRIGRLSAHEYSVIVCAVAERRIVEYSPDGVQLRLVRLSPADGFDHLWHAIKVTGEHFLVSNMDEKIRRHRICLVDSSRDSGVVVSRTADSKKLRLDTPICLTEDKDRSVLVVNANNDSITVLSTDLLYARKTLRLLSAGGYPMRICLDASQGSLLFVAVNDGFPSEDIWHSGRIAVYSIV